VPAKYVPKLLTAEWQEHCLYVDSDLLECAKDDKSIKILLLEIKKAMLITFSISKVLCAMKRVKAKIYIGIFMYKCYVFATMQFALNSQEQGSLVHGQCNTMYRCARPNLCSNFSQISHYKRMSPPVLCRHGSM
jgi:hypothetical protein